MKITMRRVTIGLYTMTAGFNMVLFLLDSRAFHFGLLGGLSVVSVISILYHKLWAFRLLTAITPLHLLIGGTTLYSALRLYGLGIDLTTLAIYLGLGSYSALFLCMNIYLIMNRKNINLSLKE